VFNNRCTETNKICAKGSWKATASSFLPPVSGLERDLDW